MTIKVRGIKAARWARNVMATRSKGMAEYGRASEVEATYWVYCPTLDALGEQMVLEGLPHGSLILVEEATYRGSTPVVVRVPS